MHYLAEAGRSRPSDRWIELLITFARMSGRVEDFDRAHNAIQQTADRSKAIGFLGALAGIHGPTGAVYEAVQLVHTSGMPMTPYTTSFNSDVVQCREMGTRDYVPVGSDEPFQGDGVIVGYDGEGHMHTAEILHDAGNNYDIDCLWLTVHDGALDLLQLRRFASAAKFASAATAITTLHRQPAPESAF